MTKVLYNITKDDLDFAAIVKADQVNLENRFATAHEKIEQILNLFEEPNRISRDIGLEKNATFWNVARYISIISLDLKILAKHQALSTNEWEKRLFSRQISLLIYESMDDIFSLLGKDFNKIANDYNADENIKNSLKASRSSLNQFKEKYFEKLKIHRNTSVAHRDKDADEQLKTIYSISWVESVNMCSQFDQIINQIGRFLEDIMRKGITDGDIKFDAF